MTRCIWDHGNENFREVPESKIDSMERKDSLKWNREPEPRLTLRRRMTCWNPAKKPYIGHSGNLGRNSLWDSQSFQSLCPEIHFKSPSDSFQGSKGAITGIRNVYASIDTTWKRTSRNSTWREVVPNAIQLFGFSSRKMLDDIREDNFLHADWTTQTWLMTCMTDLSSTHQVLCWSSQYFERCCYF